MSKWKLWLARRLGITPIVYSPLPEPIDQDIYFRNTGKTTMRMKATCNFARANPGERIVYIVSTEQYARNIRALFREICGECKNIDVITTNAIRIGARARKVIRDEFLNAMGDELCG